MIKRGFTLAEVLISLAIIGVIASLTLPTLQTNLQKQQVGPALAKAVNTLENANKLVLSENNARKLSEIGGGTYLNSLTSISWKEENVKRSKRLGTATIQSISNRNCYTTKDGIQFCESTVPANATFGNSNMGEAQFNQTRVRILIDVNGDKAPNKEGSDIFRFTVENDGSVIAFGSREHQQRYNSNVTWWENGGCDSPKAAPKQPGTCAGSIVDNGFKVIY